MEHGQSRFRSFTRPDRNLKQRSFQRTMVHLIFADETIIYRTIFLHDKSSVTGWKGNFFAHKLSEQCWVAEFAAAAGPTGRFGWCKCNQSQLMFAETLSWMRICPFIYWSKNLFHPELNTWCTIPQRSASDFSARRTAAFVHLSDEKLRPEPDMFLLRLVSEVTYSGICSQLVSLIWVQQRKYLPAACTSLQRAFLRPAAERSPL